MYNLFCPTCGMDQLVEGTRAEADLIMADHAHSIIEIDEIEEMD